MSSLHHLLDFFARGRLFHHSLDDTLITKIKLSYDCNVSEVNKSQLFVSESAFFGQSAQDLLHA